MKALLTVIAVIELGVGMGMLAVPSFVWGGLLGSPPGTAAEVTIARVVAVALLALALVCWLLRNEGGSRAMRELVSALLLFNGGTAGVLLYAGLGLGLFGAGFWPGVLFHTAIAVWCFFCLLSKPIRASEMPQQ